MHVQFYQLVKDTAFAIGDLEVLESNPTFRIRFYAL